MRAALLAAFLLAAAAVSGQAPAGGERAAGVVLDLDLRPVAGAVVTLEAEGGAAGPGATRTDAAGRWAVTGLAPGRWRIRIQAEGFIDATGFLVVGADSGPLEVRLRSLDEISPRGFEGDTRTVVRWLEKGNSLLAQGRAAAARSEYLRALPLLPRAERPQVLRAVARTHWLEGDAEATLAVLEEAAAAAPEDPDTVRLLAAVLEALDRADEIGAVLERARSRPPAEPALPRATPFRPGAEPVRAPEPGLPGRYRTRFAEPGPLSGIETYRARFGLTRAEIEQVDPDSGRYDPLAESFEIHVPEGQAPAAGWGLLVWVSPTPAGGYPGGETAGLLDRHRLIWAGANRSGNERLSWYRTALALDAAHHLRRLYPVDPDRVYVAGYSGGGRVASALAMLYPEVFRGGIFLSGTNFYRPIPVPDRPGHSWPARFPRPPREAFRLLREERSFVLLTGELDFNRSETRRVYEEMLADGFRHVSYLQIPEAGHYDLVRPDWLERSIALLDGSPDR